MAQVITIGSHQISFLDEDSMHDKIRMVEEKVQKTEKKISGLFKACSDLKKEMVFLSDILEDMHLEQISYSGISR